MSYTVTLSSPLGKIDLSFQEGKLTHLGFPSEESPCTSSEEAMPQQVIKELSCYFDNPKHVFHIPFSLDGTPFQQAVWKALLAIPAGQTLTYGQLAKQLNTSPRAIGQACRTNRIPIIIPCHRIVATQGLGGYSGVTAGKFTDIKRWLLKHEG